MKYYIQLFTLLVIFLHSHVDAQNKRRAKNSTQTETTGILLYILVLHQVHTELLGTIGMIGKLINRFIVLRTILIIL